MAPRTTSWRGPKSHRWWRSLAGTGGLIGVFFGRSVIALGLETVLYGISAGTLPASILTRPVRPDLSATRHSTPCLTRCWLCWFYWRCCWWFSRSAKEAQKRPAGTLSSVTARMRWRWLVVCLALAAGFWAVLVGAALLGDFSVDGSAIAGTMDSDVTSGGWGQVGELAELIVWIVLAEYIFRGWILQAVGACTLETRRGPVGRALSVLFRTPWPAIVISAALFAGMVDYGGGGLDLFVFGVVAGWVAVRTGGLEASIALAAVYLVGLGLEQRRRGPPPLAARHHYWRCAAVRGRCGVAGPSSAHPDRRVPPPPAC